MRKNFDEDSNQSEFQADENLGSQGSGQRDSTMASSPGGSSSSKSPNEQKHSKAFQSLLAQQCLGEDVLRIGNRHLDLADPMQKMFPASNSGLNGLSSCPDYMQNNDDSVYLRSAINTNALTDPFQNDVVHNRENLAM